MTKFSVSLRITMVLTLPFLLLGFVAGVIWTALYVGYDIANEFYKWTLK